MKKKIIIGLAIVVVLILLSIVFIPKINNSYKDNLRKEGCQVCVAQIINIILNDLRTQGFTQINIGNETIRLGVIQNG